MGGLCNDGLLVVVGVCVGVVLLVGYFYWSWRGLLVKLVFLVLKDFFFLVLDMVDLDMFVVMVCQYQVGVFFFGDDVVIVKVQCLCWMLIDQMDCLWQGEGIVFGVGDVESGIQQVGGVIVR